MLEVINRCINAGLPPRPPTRLPGALVLGNCAQEGASGEREREMHSAAHSPLLTPSPNKGKPWLSPCAHLWLDVRGVDAANLQLPPPNF